MSKLGILTFKHHGALHIFATWSPIHLTIAIDGHGWRLLDGQHKSVLMRFAWYRMHRQSVLVIGRFAFRLDHRKPIA